MLQVMDSASTLMIMKFWFGQWTMSDPVLSTSLRVVMMVMMVNCGLIVAGTEAPVDDRLELHESGRQAGAPFSMCF